MNEDQYNPKDNDPQKRDVIFKGPIDPAVGQRAEER